MIFLYSGTPGSGKSLHQASDAFFWLKAGKPLIANYSLNLSAVSKKHADKLLFTELDNSQLTPNFLRRTSMEYFSTHRFREGAIRLYIDEAQILFNCRDWGKQDRSDWIKFFTQHRKFGYDIYLIAQFDSMLDKQVRSLIEYEIIHRKLSNFGLKGKILSLLMGSGTFVAVKVWYPLKEKVGSEFFHYRRWLSRLYDSYKDFEQTSPSAEGTPSGVASALVRPADAFETREAQAGSRVRELPRSDRGSLLSRLGALLRPKGKKNNPPLDYQNGEALEDRLLLISRLATVCSLIQLDKN